MPPPGRQTQERRIDPDDGQLRSLDELREKYAKQYTPQEIDAYFQHECKPAPSGSGAATAAASASVSAGELQKILDELQQGYRVAGLDKDELEEKMSMQQSLQEALQRALAEAGLKDHGLEAAKWTTMVPGVKTIADVAAKVERLGDFMDLEDHDTERLRSAIAAASRAPAATPAPPRAAGTAGYAATPAAPKAQPAAAPSKAPAKAPQRPPPGLEASEERRVDPEDSAAVTKEELKQRYAGHYSDAEIEAYWAEECKPVPPPAAAGSAKAAAKSVPAAAPAAEAAEEDAGGECEVQGLADWLQSLNLQQHLAQAAKWCEEMGAVGLDEVKDNWQDLADALPLKSLERKRLERAMS